MNRFTAIFRLVVALLVFDEAIGQANNSVNVEVFHHRPPPVKSKDPKAAPPAMGYFVQRLDNFNPYNAQTWNMRMYMNFQFFQSGGPIFIMIGGEWEISPDMVQGGQMYDMAQQVGAAMYYTEHRYYGKSRPLPNLYTASLQYLTSQQAIADLATFITALKASPVFLKSKVVVFGGSYAGNLAIWLKQIYPQLIHAAVSSSAPVQARVDFKEYFEVVQKALENPACYGTIRNGIITTQTYLATGSAGISKVQNDFRLCYPVKVNDFYDKAYFYQGIAQIFGGIVQYATGTVLKDTCTQLMNPSLPNDYARLANFIASKRTSCVGNYQDYVNYYANPNAPGDYRQWLFQTCNEFGYYQTSSSTNQPFGNAFPIDYFYRMCADLFGSLYGQVSVNAAVAKTNAYYKGQAINVTRVVSYQGTFDPWSPLGLQKDMNSQGPALIVPRTSHIQDMYSLSVNDPADLKNAKLKEQAWIKQWLTSP